MQADQREQTAAAAHAAALRAAKSKAGEDALKESQAAAASLAQAQALSKETQAELATLKVRVPAAEAIAARLQAWCAC